MSQQKVSIIIAVRNAEKTVERCVESLKALEHRGHEVVFVDDGSTDATTQLISKDPGIKLLMSGRKGPSKARNVGIFASNSEFIAFTDADCIVEKDWLDQLLKGFDDDKVAAVGGDQKSPADDSVFGKNVHGFLKAVGFVADYVKSGSKAGGLYYTKHNPTCNVMYRAKVLKEAVGFLEGLWPGEDLELDHRLAKKGYRFRYNPGAVVYHYRPGTLKRFFGMMINYGYAQAFLVKKYGPFRFIHFEPLILALLAGACVVRPAEAVFAAAAFALAVYFYFVIKSGSFKGALVYLKLFVCALAGWNYGFIKELVK